MTVRVSLQFPYNDQKGHECTHWYSFKTSVVPRANELVEINLTWMVGAEKREDDVGELVDAVREYRVKEVMRIVPPREIDGEMADVLVELW